MADGTARAVVVIVACVVGRGQAADLTEIQLGGPRKAVATISEEDGFFQIAVSLIPVRCFDAPLNARLTREKALAYAQTALGRHVTGKSSGTVALKVRNAEIIDSRMEQHRAVLTVRYPKDGVVAKPTSSEEQPKSIGQVADSIKPWKTGGLLTAKTDQLATLQSLVDVLNAETPKVPQQAGDGKAFYQAVADEEEVAIRRFEQFRSAVKTDNLLLTIEREEILEAADTAQQEFLSQLKLRVKRFENKAAKD